MRLKQNPPTPLARHRMSRGYSQKKFARLMDVQPATVCRWEMGKARPEPARIPEIAKHLGIEPLRVAEMVGVAPEQETR